MDPLIKAMFLDKHAAAGAALFGVRAEELSFIGGFQNFVHSYSLHEVKYILRFTPSTHRTSEAIAAELEWIRFLADHGLPVAASIPSVAGNDVERIGGEVIDFYVTSFTYAPGRKIGYSEFIGNAELYEQCGRITGRLHELSRQYKPEIRRHSWEHNEYLVQAEHYLPDSEQPIITAIEELRGQLARLPLHSNRYGLIHGDMNVGNFHVEETGELILFDFDECQYSSYAEDIAVQLYYLLYVFGDDSKAERKEQYEQFMRYFELGYTEGEGGRSMPEGWREQLELYLRLREIIVVVGMHRSLDLTRPDEWSRDFLRESRLRITQGISIIDGF